VAVYLDDKKLIKQLLAGDEQAFERFFEENFARLYRFALRWTTTAATVRVALTFVAGPTRSIFGWYI